MHRVYWALHKNSFMIIITVTYRMVCGCTHSFQQSITKFLIVPPIICHDYQHQQDRLEGGAYYI